MNNEFEIRDDPINELALEDVNVLGDWDLDLSVATGKSIAESYLARMYPNLKLTGAFESASCEVVTKVPQSRVKDKGISYMSGDYSALVSKYLDSNVKLSEFPDESLPLKNKGFLGYKTTSGMTGAISSKELGINIAGPIRAVGKLSAINRMAGGTDEDVSEFFEALYGEEMPDKEIICPLVPESYAPRIMASINKSHQAIFGHESEHAGISISTEMYTRKTFGDNATADWARFTTGMRYVMIANGYYDPELGPLLRSSGISLPFAPPRHSVNHVSPASLRMPKLDSSKIVACRAFESNLKSFAETTNHASLQAIISQRVLLIQKRLNADLIGDEETNEMLAKYVEMVKRRGKFMANANTRKFGTEEISSGEPMEYVDRFKLLVEVSNTPNDILVKELADSYRRAIGKQNRLNEGECISQLSQLDHVYRREISDSPLLEIQQKLWRSIAPVGIVKLIYCKFLSFQPNKEKAIDRVVSYLGKVICAPIKLDASFDTDHQFYRAAGKYNVKIYKLLLHTIKGKLRDAMKIPPPLIVKKPEEIIPKTTKNIHDVIILRAREWGKKYYANSLTVKEQLGKRKQILDKEKLALIVQQQLASAFSKVSIGMIKNKENAYFTDKLEENYLYTSAVAIKRKRRDDRKMPNFENITSNKTLAALLDDHIPAKCLSFLATCNKVNEHLDMLYADFEKGIELVDEKYKELIMVLEPEKVVVTKPFGALTAGFFKNKAPALRNIKMDVKGSWDDMDEMLHYAAQKGCKDFDSFYEKFGVEAMKDTFLANVDNLKLIPYEDQESEDELEIK